LRKTAGFANIVIGMNLKGKKIAVFGLGTKPKEVLAA